MVEQHSLKLFGQKTGMIFSTNAREDESVFVRCIKLKKDGSWQKFDEGKSVKLSLIELVAICDVLNKSRKIFNTFHSYNNMKTPISFAWDENDNDLLWINIDEYSRPVNYPENELLRKFMEHLLSEKIEFATIQKAKEEKSESSGGLIKSIDEAEKIEDKPQAKSKRDDGTQTISASIKMAREKAILVNYDGREMWLPRSTIKNEFNANSTGIQEFEVMNWVLEGKKNG